MAELKRLLVLMIPLYIGNLMHMGMGVVDTIVAGRAGTSELAGVALGVSVAAPITVAIGMVLTIVGPIISRYRGAGYESKVGLLLNNARYAAAILLVVMLLALYGTTFAFDYVTDDAALAEKARHYVYYIMLGAPAILLMRLAQGNFEGYGQTRPAMLIAFFGLLLNIPLDFALVFGWWGVPAMGGPGCGLATAIIHWMMCAGMYGIMLGSRHRTRTLQMWSHRAVEPGMVRAVFRLGVPLGVASLCEMTFFSAVVLVIAPLGELMVSAQQVAINVSGVIFMLPLSLGIAGSIRASYHLGARAGYGACRGVDKLHHCSFHRCRLFYTPLSQHPPEGLSAQQVSAFLSVCRPSSRRCAGLQPGLGQDILNLLPGFFRPVLVGNGAGRAGVKNRPQSEAHMGQSRCCELHLFERIAAHADEAAGLQDFNDAAEMLPAGGVNLRHLLPGQLGRGDVGAAFAHPDKRAVVGDVGLAEKVICRTVHLLKQPPEATAAYLRARTVEPLYRTLRVGRCRTTD